MKSLGILTQPLRILRSAVELVCCFEKLIPSLAGRLHRACQQFPHILSAHGFECLNGLQGLIENLHGINARYDCRGGKVHSVMEALDGAHHF